jgi:hypothetical protein
MNLSNFRSIFLAILLVFLVLLPIATGLIGLLEDSDLFDEDDLFTADSFIAVWSRILTHQMLPGLIFGMSIFTLFVVYLGGRSNHRRFNDRTIDFINVLRGTVFATALLRAVFVFLFADHHPGHTNKQFYRKDVSSIIFIPIGGTLI